MPKYMVKTNATEEKTVEASNPQEAVAMYHQMVGDMPQNWDGALHVRDAECGEWSYRRREAA